MEVVLNHSEDAELQYDLFLLVEPRDPASNRIRSSILFPRGDGSFILERKRLTRLKSRITKISGFIPGACYRLLVMTPGRKPIETGWKEAVAPNIVFFNISTRPSLPFKLSPPPSSPGECVVWALAPQQDLPHTEGYSVKKGQDLLKVLIDQKPPGSEWLIGGMGEDWVAPPVSFYVPKKKNGAPSAQRKTTLFLEKEKHAIIRVAGVANGINHDFAASLWNRLSVAWIGKNGSIEDYYHAISLAQYLSSGSRDYFQICMTKNSLILRNLPFYPCTIIVYDEWYRQAHQIVVKDKNFRGEIDLTPPPMSWFLGGRRLAQEFLSKPGINGVYVLIDQEIQAGGGSPVWYPAVQSWTVARNCEKKWMRPSFWYFRYDPKKKIQGKNRGSTHLAKAPGTEDPSERLRIQKTLIRHSPTLFSKEP